MSKWAPAMVAVLALVLTAACTLSVGTTRQITNADLRAMAIRINDLPPGFRPVEEKFSSNQEFAEQFTEPGEVRGLLENWGRVTGYTNVFITTANLAQPPYWLFVTSSLDRYRDVEHARRAWDGQEGLLHYAKVPVDAATSFDAPPLGDQSAALRMVVTGEGGKAVVVYWIYFRQSTVVADVSTFTPADLDDGGEQTVHLARRLHAHVSTRLK